LFDLPKGKLLIMVMGSAQFGRNPVGSEQNPMAARSQKRRLTRAELRTLASCCGVHALHDGYSDVLYVLLPVWQAEFGFGYAAAGLVRALYIGAMATMQVPADFAAARMGAREILAVGTALSALSYLCAGLANGTVVLAIALLLGGIGAATQHPISSTLVAQAFDARGSRGALGTYNFAGDLGKMALPLAAAGLLSLLPWRSVTAIIGAGGLIVAALIPLLLGRGRPQEHNALLTKRPLPDLTAEANDAGRGYRGFALLLGIGVLDSATRMGFLTFLPFLLKSKGADVVAVGFGLSLVFAGGAAGKLVCGFLGQRLGISATVVLTKLVTAAGIVLLLPINRDLTLILLPLIGIALNGTSSVLYGTVPELVRVDKRQRAFGIFYTGTIGAGAIAPVIYGAFSDAHGLVSMMVAVAIVVLLTLPLVWLLHPTLEGLDATEGINV
jgi:MFS transporter, FSR family, fosmidomycin resistance protein